MVFSICIKYTTENRKINSHITGYRGSGDLSVLVTAAKNRSWLVAAVPNTKYMMKYYPALIMTSGTNDNRRLTWMLLEVVVGEKMTKTN